jgi:hypothetical protein
MDVRVMGMLFVLIIVIGLPLVWGFTCTPFNPANDPPVIKCPGSMTVFSSLGNPASCSQQAFYTSPTTYYTNPFTSTGVNQLSFTPNPLGGPIGE